MSHLDITRENYDECIANVGKPVLLDFWAPRCSPCRQLLPILEQLSRDRSDIFVGKVNVDEQPELAKRYKVMSIPTLMVVKGGYVTAKAVGFRTREEILQLLEQE